MERGKAHFKTGNFSLALKYFEVVQNDSKQQKMDPIVWKAKVYLEQWKMLELFDCPR